MSQADETFFTSVGCMDGRSECTVAKYGREKFGVKFADAITEAGIVALLAHNPDQQFLDSVKQKVLISVEKHHSKNIIVSGHQECAGNPVDDDQHIKDVFAATEIVRSFVSTDVVVVPAFVKRENGEWTVEPLTS